MPIRGPDWVPIDRRIGGHRRQKPDKTGGSHVLQELIADILK
jgi:hypothetical protein